MRVRKVRMKHSHPKDKKGAEKSVEEGLLAFGEIF
jgi:hypothetical protein